MRTKMQDRIHTLKQKKCYGQTADFHVKEKKIILLKTRDLCYAKYIYKNILDFVFGCCQLRKRCFKQE